MTDVPAPPLVLWTARLCIAAYLGRVTCDASGVANGPRWGRLCWTGGAVLLVLHSAAAFILVHHGSHAEAFEQTRLRTLELTGWDSGFGLWLNDLVLVWWPCDAAGWWIDARWPRRSISLAFQGLLAFLVVNATVVFGPGGWSWIALGCAAILGLLSIRRFSLPSHT